MLDLQQFDKTFEETPADPKQGVELPPGDYTMKVTDSDVFTSKGGRPFCKLVLTVVDGDLTGTSITKLYSLDDPERFRFLKNDLITLGLFLKKFSDIMNEHQKVVGKIVDVSARKKDKYTNYYLNAPAAPLENKDDVPF